MIQGVADLYDLKLEQLAALDRMGPKSAANVLRNIDRSRFLPMPRVITALGIRFVGERTAELLAEHFGSIDKIAAASVEELQEAREIGPKVAESIFVFFREEHNGFEVQTLWTIERWNKLEHPERGLREWVEMFAGVWFENVPEKARDGVVKEIESRLRPSLWREGAWWADYRRLRLIARLAG